MKPASSPPSGPPAASTTSATGTLYVVATPLGHLEDLTFRAARILKEVKLVAAEDTRRTRGLLTHLGASVPLVSYRDQNHRQIWPRIKAVLDTGGAVALVSDAGTPGVSDPGAWLVREAVAAGLAVVPLPGPSAVATALSVSGLPADAYLFAGFLPTKKKARVAVLENLKDETRTLVFFEAPHRIIETLDDAVRVLGDRPAVLGREMTKLNEEFRRANLPELLELLKSRATPLKGEVTLVVAGAMAQPKEKLTEEQLADLIRDDPRPVKEIVAELASRTDLNHANLYHLVLVATGRLAS